MTLYVFDKTSRTVVAEIIGSSLEACNRLYMEEHLTVYPSTIKPNFNTPDGLLPSDSHPVYYAKDV